MNNKNKLKLLSGILASAILLNGCGKESDCSIPSRHVHKYVKPITNEITIEKYIDSEELQKWGYNWTSDYLEINKNDEKIYKLLYKWKLFDGITNWDYLFQVMKSNKDYLEFYYEYDTVETYTTTDSEGHVEVHTRTVHHSGWHTNPNDYDNTGRVRLNHHRYIGYRIINKDGNYKIESSNDVDDIRDIIDEYSYYSEKPSIIVYEEFKFKRSELPYLRPEDFNVFNHPDLSNKELTLKK